MANINSATKPLSYWISYGFLGGPISSRKMRKQLGERQLLQAKRIEDADLVIAHSAGCWEIANADKAKLTFLVGLPLAPTNRKTSARSNADRVRVMLREHHVIAGLAGFFYNLYYAMLQPRRNLKIILQAANRQANIKLPSKSNFIVVTNRYDPWAEKTRESNFVDAHKDWTFMSMPSSHDDIWAHPDRYVAIIDHYARLLAQTNSR